MYNYLDLLEELLAHGKPREDRTGTGTLGLFGQQLRFDLREGFPLLTTKKVHMKSVIHELLWFLSGSTNEKDLRDKGVKIWSDWATEEQCAKFGREAGDLGPIYGKQFRSFGAEERPDGTYSSDGFDQISNVVEQIRNNPSSRRLVVSAWNPKEATQVALPPCHTLFQFYVQDGELSLQLYQRSADYFLGIPFNIASYAALVHMVAQVAGLKVGEFVHTFGDVHLYKNHIEQAKLQLSREPKDLPTLRLNPSVDELQDFEYIDFVLSDYQPHPAIKAPVSV